MISGNEVTAFLADFKIKLEIWGVTFLDGREKNLQTLLDLDIRTEFRRNILKELKKEDYCEGPIEDTWQGMAPMWVFGKMIKEKEIYIKITLGKPGLNVICISFHTAEHPMKYPLKVKQ